ncbi:hypothetical protein BO71DRAFT_9874 [Aspergillus ellipticus CBS 707.79]|uniref:Uncharacterized protein n=1 Tax=Aspergillus ellipticus CBS 707.79 TaxID=1448320 RepID=A0A319DXR7_9EURO|nr:hypothetical protein BO71DRAFT_9874 [Aspergillus ellipticus CBS 707.79]
MGAVVQMETGDSVDVRKDLKYTHRRSRGAMSRHALPDWVCLHFHAGIAIQPSRGQPESRVSHQRRCIRVGIPTYRARIRGSGGWPSTPRLDGCCAEAMALAKPSSRADEAAAKTGRIGLIGRRGPALTRGENRPIESRPTDPPRLPSKVASKVTFPVRCSLPRLSFKNRLPLLHSTVPVALGAIRRAPSLSAAVSPQDRPGKEQEKNSVA